MERKSRNVTGMLIGLWTGCILIFLYIPIVSVVLASFSRRRYFRFPVQQGPVHPVQRTHGFKHVRTF